MANERLCTHCVLLGRSGKSGPACKGRNSRGRRAHQESAASAGVMGWCARPRRPRVTLRGQILTLKRPSLNATHCWYIANKKAVYPLTVACAVSCRRPDLGASSSLFLPAMSRQPCGLHSPRGRATHMDVGNAASPSGTGAASYKASQHATRNWA